MRIVLFKQEDTAANLAALSGSYVPSGWYRETDTGAIKYAVDANTLSGSLQFGTASADTVQQNLSNYIASNNAALAQEIQNRQDGDTALQTAINDEATARAAADTILTDDLAAEVQARQDADTALQTAIDTEKGRIDTMLNLSDADKDSFKEIVDFVMSVDATNDTALLNAVNGLNQSIADEATARTNVIAALQNDVNTKDGQNVKITGDQDVDGIKTFKADAVFEGNAAVSGEVSGAKGIFNEAFSLVDRTTGEELFIQINDGEIFFNTTILFWVVPADYVMASNGDNYLSLTGDAPRYEADFITNTTAVVI